MALNRLAALAAVAAAIAVLSGPATSHAAVNPASPLKWIGGSLRKLVDGAPPAAGDQNKPSVEAVCLYSPASGDCAEPATGEIPAGAATAAHQTTANTTLSTIAARSLPYDDTAAALGASATFTGSWRDSGATAGSVASPWNAVVARFTPDQAGTAYIEFSKNGSAVSSSVSAAVAAATTLTLKADLTTKYWRVKLVNGGVPQSTLQISSAMTAN